MPDVVGSVSHHHYWRLIALWNYQLNSPIYAGHARNILLTADPFSEQSVSDLPCKHGGVLLLVFADSVYHWRSGNLGFAATDDTSLEVASLVIS